MVHNSSRLLCTGKEQEEILWDMKRVGGKMGGEERGAHTVKTQEDVAETAGHEGRH